MSSDTTHVLGMRVRFRLDFYFTRLLPPSDWAGTIIAETKSLMGQRTRYTVLLDAKFHVEALEKEVDAIEDEVEQCEQTNA
jgi:hypothetical protein